MEYLDYYDEQDNYLGYASRNEVHSKGYWHHTIHCWLYDLEGNVYFQIRQDKRKLYTTASGHVLHNETIEEAFKREIKEEIGLELNNTDGTLIAVVPWQMDKIKDDGSEYHDHAKAHVYLNEINDKPKFHFDSSEVIGLAKVNALDTYQLFQNEKGSIIGTIILEEHCLEKELSLEDFLVMDGETAITKYGDILKSIINKTK